MSSEGNFLFIQLTSHQSIIFSMEHVFPIHIQRIGVDILINLESWILEDFDRVNQHEYFSILTKKNKKWFEI